jgi:hypothetical protein
VNPFDIANRAIQDALQKRKDTSAFPGLGAIGMLVPAQARPFVQGLRILDGGSVAAGTLTEAHQRGLY